MKLKHQIPQIYGKLLPPSLMNLGVTETLADCGDCSMSRKNRGPRAKVTYEPDLKCCTFEPFVPNYLAGALLVDKSRFPLFSDVLQSKLKSGGVVLPMGVLPTLSFQNQFAKRKPGDFGNRSDWLCPYFNRSKNNCGIWLHRGSVCAGFYCKSDRGPAGLRWWEQLTNYLHLVEMTFAEEVLVHKGFSPRQISEQLRYFNRSRLSQHEMQELEISPRNHQKMWDGYKDPAQFYVESYQWLVAQRGQDMQQALGEAGDQLVKLLTNLPKP